MRLALLGEFRSNRSTWLSAGAKRARAAKPKRLIELDRVAGSAASRNTSTGCLANVGDPALAAW